MNKHIKLEKAYKNLDFLTSGDARTIRILAEYYEPKSRLEKLNILDTVVFFGSARFTSKEDARKNYDKVLKENSKDSGKLKAAEKQLDMSKYYEDAVEVSRMITEWSMQLPTDEKRFIVCSGGGPGIMEAANRGANEAGGKSLGLNVSIPFEQFANPYIDSDHAFEFHYFFMRKFWFVYLAKALIVFPGGFGTLDELMEVLTLRQTGKIKKELKIIVYGSEYWKRVVNFEALVEEGTIDRKDLALFDFCDSPREAFEIVTEHLRSHYFNNHAHKETLKNKTP